MTYYKYKKRLGDTRTVKKFSWLPTLINNTIIAWLGFYYEKQEVFRYNTELYWLTKERRLAKDAL